MLEWGYHRSDHFRAERAKFLQSRGSRQDVVRLHLGCGAKYFRGYINIDRDQGDEHHDIANLPEKFKPETVSEILLIHVFEHLYLKDIEKCLRRWHELLIPGGKLIMEMPDLKKVLKFFVPQKQVYVGDGIDALCPKKAEPDLFGNPGMTYHALFGGAKKEEGEDDLHKWGWSFVTLEPLLKAVGFKDIVEKTPDFHVPLRDFRVEATK